MSGRGSNKSHIYTKQLRINSSNRVDPDNSTDANFYIDLGSSLQQVQKLSVASVQFNNVFYNVFNSSVKYNNYFKVQYVGTLETKDYILNVDPGYYSVFDLAAAINTELQNLTHPIVLTIALNSITNKVSWTMAANGDAISVTFAKIDPVTDTLPSPNPIASKRQDYNPFGLLGLTLPATFTPAVLQTSTNMPSLNNPSVAYIMSSTLAPMNAFDEGGKLANVLVAIQIEVPHNALAVFDCKQDILCEVEYGRPRALNRIDIQLVDHDGDVLDLSGTELNLDLKVWLNMF